jgi:glucokinase
MNELVRCRAMESLCRQRATFYPEESWKWLAEAEMWDHKAFECSNRPEESKAAPSKSSSVGDEGSFGGRLSSSRNVPEVIGGVLRVKLQKRSLGDRVSKPTAVDVSDLLASTLRWVPMPGGGGCDELRPKHKISLEEEPCPPAEAAHDSRNAEIQLADYGVLRSLDSHGRHAVTGIDRALLADIGGTNARFALLYGGQIGPVEHTKVADYATVADAIAAFLTRHAGRGSTDAAILDVAGPIENNRVTLTNSRWTIDADDLQKSFGFSSVHLLNDFEALAWALPALGAADLFSIGGQPSMSGAPMLVVGPGTGFGVGCLVPRGATSFAIVTEAGHATLPAASEREARIIDHLRQRFGHVSIERALSGPGLETLYEALAGVDGVQTPNRDAASITEAAIDGSCGVSQAALDTFCSLLGTVCGNLALTFGAHGGVYIAGGIVPRFLDHLARSNFRKRFESKGRFEAYLRDIPVSVIIRPDVSFIGLKAYFDRNVATVGPSVPRTR